jgi:hypothetical protein
MYAKNAESFPPGIGIEPPPLFQKFLPFVVIGMALVFTTVNAVTKLLLDFDESKHF